MPFSICKETYFADQFTFLILMFLGDLGFLLQFMIGSLNIYELFT